MNLPSWVIDPSLAQEERASNRIRYHLKRAAIWHNAHGSVAELGRAMGFGQASLHNAIARGNCTRKMALAIEAFVGRDIVTREQLAPEHFLTAEA